MKRDINFFSTYQLKNQDKKSQNLYGYLFGGAVGLFVLGTLMFNQAQLHQLNKKIDELNDELASPGIVEKIAESDRVYQVLEALNHYDQEVTILVNNINSRDFVTTALLNQISSTIPTEVTFSSLSLTNTNMTMQATSQTRTAIAEVQYNLKQLPFVSDVYIGAISPDAPYTFSLSCTINGGAQ